MLKGCKQKSSETAMCCSSAWFNPSSPALFGLEKRGVRGGKSVDGGSDSTKQKD